ncbi:MAG: ABC-F family ATP-binding cassette domain-containing protein [Bacteroidales bacterium]|nr:ABC-F family ATP-binding cassette domain-containing protein [Bacteroidales bacterium]
MISVNNISVEFSGIPLFEQVSFHVSEKERIGLAGKNGAGKTTLLRILCGEQELTSGNVVVPENEKVGYLPQEKKVRSNRKVLEEALSAFSNVEDLKKQRENIQQELVTRTDYESKAYLKLFEEMNSLNDRLAILDEGQLEGLAVKVLKGLGFLEEELSRPVSTFSLGWQMRIELAKLLLLQPGLLLLDEPTNHLDLDAIQWLENYLKSYKGSVILVSHDRSFLDNLTTRTIEINNGKIYDYKVPYSHYLELRDERVNQQKAEYNNQQKQIKEIERFIERFRSKSTKARQVQSRVKHLEKMERVSIDDLDSSGIHFRFPSAPRSGKVVVEGESVSKSYGSKKVLDHVDFQIIKGEKVAFVGRNGEGKTTLSKILAKQLDYAGEIKFGHNVHTGYYAQDQWEMLDASKTVFETVDDVVVGDIRKRLTSILGAFLFQGEDIDKKISVLSGGEKARLSLARLLLNPTNLLILDEPTNHLDLLSKDILKTALLEYEGTVILVSHDRDFLSGLTERFYEFKNHKIKEFRGTLEEYLGKRNIEQLQELEAKNPEKKDQKTVVSDSQLDWGAKKEKEKRQRKLKKELERIELDIEKLEKDLQVVNEKLSRPEDFMEEIKSGELSKEHVRIQSAIDQNYETWEEIHLQLEEES